MTSRRRMEDSEHWRAFGRVEAGQSITDVAIFFRRSSFYNFTFMETIQTTQTVDRRPVAGRSRVTTPAEDRYIAILAKRNQKLTS